MALKVLILLAAFGVAVRCIPVAKQDVPSSSWRIHITMHVFSGRADPTWFIEQAHPKYIQILKSFKGVPKQNLPNRLGYRGFKLVHLPPGKLVTSGNHVNTTVTSSPFWEMMVLNSANLDHTGQLYNHAKGVILQDGARRKKRDAWPKAWDPYIHEFKTTTVSPKSENGLPSWLTDYDYSDPYSSDYNTYGDKESDPLKFNRDPNQLSNAELLAEVKIMNQILNDTNLEASSKKVFYGAPAYEPEKWNNWLHMELNNCYNYANNEITDTFATPGRATSCPFSNTHPTGKAIHKSSVCDGLSSLNDADPDSLPTHKLNLVALVFWPPEMLAGELVFDFHWYRLDNNGRFSHKPGKTEATNVDNSGKLIKDPRKADRGPYTEFVGFLETRRDKIKII